MSNLGQILVQIRLRNCSRSRNKLKAGSGAAAGSKQFGSPTLTTTNITGSGAHNSRAAAGAGLDDRSRCGLPTQITFEDDTVDTRRLIEVLNSCGQLRGGISWLLTVVNCFFILLLYYLYASSVAVWFWLSRIRCVIVKYSGSGPGFVYVSGSGFF